MSFMFNPYPYNDPNAVNHINGVDVSGALKGNDFLADRIAKAVKNGVKLAAIDGYVTAPFETVAKMFGKCRLISVRELCKPADEIDKMLADNLPLDREKDPVLLYGSIYKDGYEGIFDSAKLSEIKKTDELTVIYGNGSLCDTLKDLYDYKIFIDITPKQAVLNVKRNGYINLGADAEQPFKATMRRNYYVDFDLSFNLRGELLKNGGFDLYVCGDEPNSLTSMPYDTLKAILNRAADYPFRCRPVYLEGVWGGYYVKSLRRLPEAMRNCAWVFDLIPMEVSVVIYCGGKQLEFPYYTMIHTCREKLLGQPCIDRFGCYFPIRFNYDDTFHSSGNMSIQLHPGEKFLRENANEFGRQDESYYIVATGQGACTYLGFKNEADIDGFISDIKKSEKEYSPVDYKNYINAVKSEPGIQVMIPAGTIHASGRNQLILEIGSLTVGSYTYKMYDYLRKDLDGKPRPIHSFYGSMNLNRNMRADYVNKNLVNGSKRTLRKGEGYEEFVVGECEQLYFSLRNEVFGEKIEDNTDGYFHVLVLVDGEEVEIRSKSDTSLSFTAKHLDMVVVPASMGEYEIVNKKTGTTVVIHKTLLKS